MRTRLGRTLAALAAVAVTVVGAGAPAPAAAATAEIAHQVSQTVAETNLVVAQDASGHVAIQQGAILRAGLVHVHITSANQTAAPDVETFRLQPGATLDDMAVEIKLAVSPDPTVAAPAMRWFGKYVRFYSGDLFIPASTYDTLLLAGDYYVAQVNNPAATAVPFRVVGSVGSIDLPSANQAVTMVGPDTFRVFPASGQLHAGPLFVPNLTGEIHFALFVEVNPGTTNADVTAYFQGGLNPTKAGGRTFGVGTQSPGRAVVANLPASLSGGTFMVVDYLPDYIKGTSNASLGMHEVVTVA